MLVLFLHRGLGVGITLTIVVVIVTNIVLSWVLLGLLFPALRRREIRAALQERLRESGIHACPGCAYDMRGLSGPCPECGTEAPSIETRNRS